MLEPCDDPWLGTDEALSEVQQSRRDAAWEAIRPLTLVQPDIYEPGARAARTAERTAEVGRSQRTLYRLLRRWWQRGMRVDALTPDYANSGAPGQRRRSGTAERGAPVRYGPAGMNVDDQVRADFRASINRFLATNKKLDVAGCYSKCLEWHFTDLLINEETGRQESVLRDAHPSLRQFRYSQAIIL